MTTLPHVTIESQILSVLNDSTVPLKTGQILEEIESKFAWKYSRQHVKRTINKLIEAQRIEKIGKSQRDELFTIPGKVLDPWEDELTNASRPFIKLPDGNNYSPSGAARLLSDIKPALLNESATNELTASLTLLILQGGIEDYLRTHSISPVGQIRRPLERMRTRLQNIIVIIDAVLNNPHVKNGHAGLTIPDYVIDELMIKFEPYLMQISANNRSDVTNEEEQSARA